MKAFVFTTDAVVALLVATSLLSFSFAAQKSLSAHQASPRFSADLAASIQALGEMNSTQIQAIYSLDSKCGFVLARDANLFPVQAIDACPCSGAESVATASLPLVSGGAVQNLLIEVHSCPA